MGSSISPALNNVKNSIANAFSNLGSKITSPLSNAWQNVKNFVSNIRNAFSNIRISLPHIKMPRFSVSWVRHGIGKLSVSLPRISVTWHKKAYKDAVLFNKPTVLQTPTGAKGFGDGNGSEVVLGLKRLKELVGASGDMNTVINIYAPEGMNVNALADKIQDRLNALQKQKEMSYT